MTDWIKTLERIARRPGFRRAKPGSGAFRARCPGFGRENPLTGYEGLLRISAMSIATQSIEYKSRLKAVAEKSSELRGYL
ncbi:MAG: hypothetical protein IPJ84_14315 [Bdellovibrionales bacterium]|nr:hypothetical protein [Bdellovibrionales bacterium]